MTENISPENVNIPAKALELDDAQLDNITGGWFPFDVRASFECERCHHTWELVDHRFEDAFVCPNCAATDIRVTNAVRV